MAYQGGNLKSSSINGVKMYSITGQQRSQASWLAPKKLSALRKNKDYLQRVDLVQDLRFETATTKIKATPDGEFLIASGIYPPQVKVYELRELSLKFERHLISEIIDFQILADDYSKIAFLCADRSINLHAKHGSHYSLRIPRMGRDMEYDCWSCDLLCAASSPDLYRINLEQGRFLSPLNTQSPALNVVSRSKSHGLVACGGEDGAVECFDMRARSSVGRLKAVAFAGDSDQEVTALEFDGDAGYLMAVGSSAGKVLIYDLRSSHPLRVKDHMYSSPILDIKWHRTLNSERPKLITTDKWIVRIWDPETGEGMTSIEPQPPSVQKDNKTCINDICLFPESGLMLLAMDCSQIPSYFIPALGPAPKWCSYLENLTEEMEEGAQTTIYDNFKFLTKEDLEKLGMTSLIGSKYLRAYMHGFFIDFGLYKKLAAKADPFEYEKYIEQRKQEKKEEQLKSRITKKRRLPDVNKRLAQEIFEREEAENEKKEGGVDTKKHKNKKGVTTEDLKDERWEQIFKDRNYEVDPESYEYRALHPVAAKKDASLLEEHFEPVTDDEDEVESDASAYSSEDELDGGAKKKSRVPRLHEIKDERHAEAFWKNKSLAREDALPLGERMRALGDDQQTSRVPNNVKLGAGGSREISFVSRSSSKYKEDEDGQGGRREKRRGVQPLGLKSDRSSFRGRGRGRGGRGGGRGRGRGRGRF